MKKKDEGIKQITETLFTHLKRSPKDRMSFVDLKYFINGNVVVCQITVNLNLNIGSSAAVGVGLMEKDCVRTFTGKAKVSHGDKYDEKLGMHIAESKAKKKAYNFTKRQLAKILNNKRNFLNNIERYYQQMIKLEEREIEHIAKLSHL